MLKPKASLIRQNFNEINTLRSIASQSKIKTNYPQENM